MVTGAVSESIIPALIIIQIQSENIDRWLINISMLTWFTALRQVYVLLVITVGYLLNHIYIDWPGLTPTNINIVTGAF